MALKHWYWKQPNSNTAKWFWLTFDFHEAVYQTCHIEIHHKTLHNCTFKFSKYGSYFAWTAATVWTQLLMVDEEKRWGCILRMERLGNCLLGGKMVLPISLRPLLCCRALIGWLVQMSWHQSSDAALQLWSCFAVLRQVPELTVSLSHSQFAGHAAEMTTFTSCGFYLAGSHNDVS